MPVSQDAHHALFHHQGAACFRRSGLRRSCRHHPELVFGRSKPERRTLRPRCGPAEHRDDVRQQGPAARSCHSAPFFGCHRRLVERAAGGQQSLRDSPENVCAKPNMFCALPVEEWRLEARRVQTLQANEESILAMRVGGCRLTDRQSHRVALTGSQGPCRRTLTTPTTTERQQ